MKLGDVVSVLYETRRYYIIIEKIPRDVIPFGEQMYRLLDLRDGAERSVRYSEIRIISKAESR